METIISRCIDDSYLHARLLNTFSLVENIGARRIHRFQRFGFSDESVLQHAYEEARHAFFFKRLATRLSVETGISSETPPFSISTSRNLLRRIDLAVCRALKGCEVPTKTKLYLSYLLVTLLIEARALDVYRVYEENLKKRKLTFSIGSVLHEEEEHISYLKKTLDALLPNDHKNINEELLGAERGIFLNWLDRITKQIEIR